MKKFIALFLLVLLTLPTAITAQTRDNWRSVRTNNLFIIGNAEPEKLRQVAVWLEFFHSAFGRLVSRNVLDASVSTTVIVFRDDASFTPFKPLYQGRPANVAGYFQPGDDVNYIAMALDPRENNSFSVAFHEYVHLRLEDYAPGAPVWLNEGLAEFYGSLQFSSGEAVLGATLPYYMRLLRSQELLPLETLFSIDQRSPHYNEQDKTGIFYGQSWALVHYLMLGGGAGRQDQFRRFLQQAGRGRDMTKALEDSFGMSLDRIEKELRAYVRQGELPSLRLASGNDPEAYASYTAMQRVALSEGEANYYLGDLLLHIGRGADAERYFKHAIALDPGLTNAYAALGQLAVYQRRFPEAKKYLQRATTSPQHYLVHYHYAWLLSREAVSPNGRISEYPPESAAIMREQLSRTIKLAPGFAPAYYLLAFVNLVTDGNLDDALQIAEQARRLEPAKSPYAMLVAQIHVARADTIAARALLEPLARDSDPRIKSEAQRLLESLNNSSAGNRTAARTRAAAALGAPLAAEPVATGASRTLVVGSGSSASRDGQTIETSGSLPSIDEVLARYVEALGGAKAINALTSRVIKGTVDIPGQSRGGSFETHTLAPNKSTTVMEAYPFGRINVGYNGRSGWSQTTQGVQQIKLAAELASLQRDSDLYAPVRVKNNYAKVTLAGTSHIGYREVYVLDLQPAAGAVERLYLDVKTYLPARLNTTRKLGAVLAPVEVYLDDWQTVDGIKYPFSISQRFSKLTLSFTVKEIRHNIPIDASLFEPPIK